MQPRILKKTFCRLCLNTISDSNCQVIEKDISDILKIVLPHLNLDEEVKYFMCTTCSIKLFAAFNFKSVCMDTEDLIFPHINANEMSVIDLKEVYLKEKGNIQLNDISEDWRICRLCFQPVTYEFVALNEVDLDIIDTYIPQVNISATRDPVICTTCCDSLRTHGSFLKNCLDAQEKCTNVDKQSYVKTEEIEIKLEGYQDSDTQLQSSVNEPSMTSDCKDTEEDGSKAENRTANKCNIEIKQERKIVYKYDKCDDETESEKCLTTNCAKQENDSVVYECESSKYETKNKKLLQRHENISKIRMHQYDSCNYKTKCKSNLAKHQVKPKAQLYKCNFCDFKTKWRSSFKRHCIKYKHSNKCDEYNYKTKFKALPHKDTSQQPIYKCDGCNYESKDKSNFLKHQLVHKDPSQAQMYKCNDCEYKTKYKYNIKQHQLKHKDPSQIQMYRCNDCDYETRHSRHLKQHQLKHKDPLLVQTYKCNDCDFETKYKGDIKIHQLKHTNPSQIQMYKCNDCNYKTKYKTNFKQHKLKHKDPSQTQMYRCEECDFETKYRSVFKKHQLKHKDLSQVQTYRCNDCNYETIHRCYIKSHELKHKDPSQVQMYKCNDCDYETKYKSNINSHKLKHKHFL